MKMGGGVIMAAFAANLITWEVCGWAWGLQKYHSVVVFGINMTSTFISLSIP